MDRSIRWRVCGTAVAVLAGTGAAFVFLAPHGAGLPPYVRHQNLPPSFDAALLRAREQAEAGRGSPESVRPLAQLYLANGLYDEAMACYHSARLAPRLTARDHYYVAQIDQAEGNLEGAVSELRACVGLAPDYIAARLQLADCLFKSGDGEGAGRTYCEVLSRDPGQAQAMFGVARVDLQGGDEAAAMAELDRLTALHPDNASGAGLYAQILDRKGEPAKAAAMTLLSRQKPEVPAADPWNDDLFADCFDLQKLSLGFEQFFNAGAIERAVPLMNRVEEIDPGNPIPKFVQGWSLARAHRDAEAVEQYRSALDKGGDPEKICPFMVQSLIALDRLDEANRLLAAEYAARPDSVPLLTTYSDLAVRRGDTPMAKRLLTKVLERQPDLLSANMALAKILWNTDDRDAAVRYLQRVADDYPGEVGSRALLGEYYLGRDEAERAIAPLEQALASAQTSAGASQELSSNLYRAYLSVAKRLAETGNPAAETMASKAIRLIPGEPDAYALKAAICAGQGRLDEAAESLEKLAAIQPDNPTVFLSWGDVAYKKGDAPLAAQKWRTALSLTPTTDVRLKAAIQSRLQPAGGSQ